MPNTNAVLITNPRFDTATEFTNLWTKEVISEALNLGLNTTYLEENDARLSQFQDSLASKDPILLIAAGHGVQEVFTGQDQEHLLWTPSAEWGHDDSNVALVSGRITYLLSCLTGQVLGPAIVAQPDTYYIGYTEDFIFAGWDPGDKYSQAFGECTNAIARTLLRGGTLQDAYNEGIRMFDLWISIWQQSSDPSAPFIVSALLHNRDVLIIYPGMPVPPPGVPVESPLMGFLTSGYGMAIALAFI